jgi:acetyl esterase
METTLLYKIIRRTLIGITVLALLAAAAYTTFYLAFEPDRKVIYSQPGGVELSLALFGLNQSSNGALPAILFYHGGAWTAGSPIQFYPWAKHYAELGWVAVSAEYRLNGSNGTNAFDAVADARAAYLFLQQNASELGIDPHRIILAGGSAGGHLAAAVAMTPWFQRDAVPAPAALVLFNPALNTVYDEEVAIAHLFEDKGEQISPMHHIMPGLPPMLILHGDEDELVPINESRDFCKRMVAADNRCTLIEYQGAGHGFFNWGGGNYDEVMADVVNYTGD